MNKELPVENGTLQVRPVLRQRGFSLVEILVVVALLSLIVLALMAVFSSTQDAFRASVTQTDVLEGGRAAMDMIATDLKLVAPADANRSTGLPNFYAVVTNGFTQFLPASTTLRDSAMQDVFFLQLENQTWAGIGYFIRTNSTFTYPAATGMGSWGSLYRFQTNARSPLNFKIAFDGARHGLSTPAVSKVMDGVLGFRVRAYDTNGFWITSNTNNIAVTTNLYWGEMLFCAFYSNAVPASVEVELATLEDRARQRIESLPTTILQTNYLAHHAGQVHIFRQRIAIPNVDPAAYQ